MVSNKRSNIGDENLIPKKRVKKEDNDSNDNNNNVSELYYKTLFSKGKEYIDNIVINDYCKSNVTRIIPFDIFKMIKNYYNAIKSKQLFDNFNFNKCDQYGWILHKCENVHTQEDNIKMANEVKTFCVKNHSFAHFPREFILKNFQRKTGVEFTVSKSIFVSFFFH